MFSRLKNKVSIRSPKWDRTESGKASYLLAWARAKGRRRSNLSHINFPNQAPALLAFLYSFQSIILTILNTLQFCWMANLFLLKLNYTN